MVGLLWAIESEHVVTTVVPVMNGHPRDQAQVSLRDMWPLVRGTGAWALGERNLVRLSTTITTSDIHTEYMHCCML